MGYSRKNTPPPQRMASIFDSPPRLTGFPGPLEPLSRPDFQVQGHPPPPPAWISTSFFKGPNRKQQAIEKT